MDKIQHKTINANAINIHVAEIGEGLFLHGFPELWYSWRHQMISLSSSGYRAIAPDLRGYGDTDAPPSAASYTAFHVVGDLVGVLDALGLDRVFLVGQDWGALIAWYFCLFLPDRIKALVNLSVVLHLRNPRRKPVESMRAIFGDDYYICRFQVKISTFGNITRSFAKFHLWRNTELYKSLKRELEEFIQTKLLYPGMDIHSYHELLSAMRLLISEDQCGGRFVFSRQIAPPPPPSNPCIIAEAAPPVVIQSGPGGDNAKSQLQTLLTRAGHAPPVYRTKQLTNNQFVSTVEFNGMQIMGQPFNNKKQAEKEAAAEALQWILGRNQARPEYVDRMSMLLKKSKRDHKY